MNKLRRLWEEVEKYFNTLDLEGNYTIETEDETLGWVNIDNEHRLRFIEFNSDSWKIILLQCNDEAMIAATRLLLPLWEIISKELNEKAAEMNAAIDVLETFLRARNDSVD